MYQKECTKCKVTKLIYLFAKDKWKKDWYYSSCKVCII